MKVITLWQPWASLVIDGKKRIETRSWKTDLRGLIGIHAAQRCPLHGLLDMGEDKMQFVFQAYEKDRMDWIKEFPVGVILGHVTLSACFLITEEYAEAVKMAEPEEYAFGDFTPGRYAWVMDDPVKFPEPVPARGKQRIWEFSGLDTDREEK